MPTPKGGSQFYPLLINRVGFFIAPIDDNQREDKESLMVTKLLKSDDIAQLLGVSKSFAYKLIRLGVLPSVRMGRSVRVRQEDLDLFIVSNVRGNVSGINQISAL